jgi:hypothetical protein
MAKQFDESLAAVARPALSPLGTVPFYFGMLVLAVAFIYLGASGEIAAVGLVALAAAGVGLGFFYATQERRRLAAVRGGALTYDTALPEVQRETLLGEVVALSRVLDIPAEQMGDLQSAYIVAEDLALRQVQQEENVPVLRHVAVFGIPFDAVMWKGDVVVCADVQFLVAPDVRQDKVEAAIRKVGVVRRSLPADRSLSARLMLVLITQLAPEDEDRLRSVLKTKRFAETEVDIDIRLLDFETLQRIYVTD